MNDNQVYWWIDDAKDAPDYNGSAEVMEVHKMRIDGKTMVLVGCRKIDGEVMMTDTTMFYGPSGMRESSTTRDIIELYYNKEKVTNVKRSKEFVIVLPNCAIFTDQVITFHRRAV